MRIGRIEIRYLKATKYVPTKSGQIYVNFPHRIVFGYLDFTKDRFRTPFYKKIYTLVLGKKSEWECV